MHEFPLVSASVRKCGKSYGGESAKAMKLTCTSIYTFLANRFQRPTQAENLFNHYNITPNSATVEQPFSIGVSENFERFVMLKGNYHLSTAHNKHLKIAVSL